MKNEDIMDLYERVSVRTRVVFSDPPRVEIAKPAGTQPQLPSSSPAPAPIHSVATPPPASSEMESPLAQFDIFD
jgi:hypothetical protein